MRTGQPLTAWIDSVGIIGPGLDHWREAASVLRNQTPWQARPIALTLPPILPAAERRRTSVAVKVALQCGHQAALAASWPAESLVAVFASSGGDGDNCHAICEALSTSDRLISPTRFHNSVHNAPAGYWSIAVSACSGATSLCAYDGSFAAGLLEAMTELTVGQHPVILIAYDAPYPEPLRSARPVAHPFGVALVIGPEPGPRSLASITVTTSTAAASRMQDPYLEALRTSVPTARSLPLLQALACGSRTTLILDYLESPRLAVAVAPLPALAQALARGLEPQQ